MEHRENCDDFTTGIRNTDQQDMPSTETKRLRYGSYGLLFVSYISIEMQMQLKAAWYSLKGGQIWVNIRSNTGQIHQ